MQDVAESVRLVGYLEAHGSPITTAILAHDTDLDLWSLLLAVPRSSTQSKAALYTEVQTAITEMGLSLSLSRITRILDTEPLVGILRKLVEDSFSNVAEIPLGGSELAGATVDTVFAFNVSAIRYEGAVLSALLRVRPPDTVLHRSASLSLTDGFDFDFILDGGALTAIIETRSIRRPLIDKDIQRVSVVKEDVIDYPHASLVIIAKNGFSQSAYHWVSNNSQKLGRLRQIILVKWDGEDDDQALLAALSSSISQ
jgi:hypothetical protein